MTEDDNRINIYISTHKASDSIENKFFTPIQVGTSVKGNKKLPDILHDNTGDNISSLNPKFCELTAQYWVWKNSPKADFIGFFHYRRYLSFNTKKQFPTDIWGNVVQDYINSDFTEKFRLNPKTIKETIQHYDIILPKKKDIRTMPNMGKNNYEQYTGSGYLHEQDLKILLQVIEEKSPDLLTYAQKYFDDHMTYLNNMFIMRKEIFADYCEWLFDILFECENRIDYTFYSKEAIRTPGHLAERLLNIYILYLIDKKHIKIKELQTIVILNTDPNQELLPAFTHNNIPVVFSANNHYVPYLATVIESIIENSSANNSYDIIILNKDICARNQTLIKSMSGACKNFSIRFLDISKYEDKFSGLFLRGHFTIETWFRLLLPEILNNYDKVLYLDADIVVLDDLSKLFKTNIDGKLLGACHDADTAGLYNGYESDKKEYMDTILKIRKPYDYFQAGVLLLNLHEFRKQIKVNDMLRFAGSYDWQLLDQDVLNYLAQGKVTFIDMSWNIMYDWGDKRLKEIISRAPEELEREYVEARNHPRIVHYAGPDKPWDGTCVDYGDLFWYYSRKTPFYEELLLRLISSTQKREKENKKIVKKQIKKTLKKIFPANSRRGTFIRTARSRIINK